MDLSNRMVQSFCRVLKKSGLVNNNAGDEEIDSNPFINTVTHFTVRRNTRDGQPDGMVLTAIASIKLPIPPQTVFHFLSDEEKRQEVLNKIFRYINSVFILIIRITYRI